MSTLDLAESYVLESAFAMGGGYVLNFSNESFRRLVHMATGQDITDARYATRGPSKANRLRRLWELESDETVARLTDALLEHGLKMKQIARSDAEPVRRVVTRLMGTPRPGELPPAAARSDAPLPPGREPPRSAAEYARTADSAVREPPRAVEPPRPVEIFFSYAHEDEALMNDVRRQLVIYERRGRIIKRHDRQIPPGTAWRNAIDHRLEHSEIILLFVSPAFLESDYCSDVEVATALRRHTQGTARVIPIILRPCAWEHAPFAELQVLPRDATPLSQFRDRDQACLDVARAIMRVVDEFQAGGAGRRHA